MSIQVSGPLALHLRRQITSNIFSNQYFRPGEAYKDGQTLNELGFIIGAIDHMKAIQLWATIIRAFYQHPDWSQLVAFFDKRYSKSQMLSGRSARKLHAPADSTYMAGKSATVNFLTDPSSVGLPKDLPAQLAEACRASHGNLIGPDPKGTSIGPAISVAIGATAYMDLIYNGLPQGQERIPELAMFTNAETQKKSGRRRTALEWHVLFRHLADWIYEHDAASIVHHFHGSHSYQYRLSDAEMASIRFGDKVPRQYLKTDAIEAADGLRDVFEQIAGNTARFHGIEWDFLKLQAKAEVEQDFYRRFGQAPGERAEGLNGLLVQIPIGECPRGHAEVPPGVLKACPVSFDGGDWERWLLSVEGGDVVVVRSVFQALWAVTLLTQWPLEINILGKGEKIPAHRDTSQVYL